MIIHRAGLTLVACVAAIAVLVTGCSSSSSATPTPAATSAATATTSAAPAPSPTPSVVLGEPVPGFDEWDQWNSGETSPEFQAVMAQLGLTVAAFPTNEFANQGFLGVAQFGSSCIIAFSNVGADTATSGHMSAAIFSRFTPTGLTAVQPNATIDQIRAFMAQFAAVCNPASVPSAPATTI